MSECECNVTHDCDVVDCSCKRCSDDEATVVARPARLDVDEEVESVVPADIVVSDGFQARFKQAVEETRMRNAAALKPAVVKKRKVVAVVKKSHKGHVRRRTVDITDSEGDSCHSSSSDDSDYDEDADTDVDAGGFVVADAPVRSDYRIKERSNAVAGSGQVVPLHIMRKAPWSQSERQFMILPFNCPHMEAGFCPACLNCGYSALAVRWVFFDPIVNNRLETVR